MLYVLKITIPIHYIELSNKYMYTLYDYLLNDVKICFVQKGWAINYILNEIHWIGKILNEEWTELDRDREREAKNWINEWTTNSKIQSLHSV